MGLARVKIICKTVNTVPNPTRMDMYLSHPPHLAAALSPVRYALALRQRPKIVDPRSLPSPLVYTTGEVVSLESAREL